MEQSTESSIRRDTDVRPYVPLNLCYAYHHYAERVSSTNEFESPQVLGLSWSAMQDSNSQPDE